jgi:hypothetical protein
MVPEIWDANFFYFVLTSEKLQQQLSLVPHNFHGCRRGVEEGRA